MGYFNFKENIMIKIQTEKLVTDSGIISYHIKGLDMLGPKELPKEYLNSFPHCYYIQDWDMVKVAMDYNNVSYTLRLNNCYDVKTFNKILDDIRQCATKLTDIKEEQKEKRKSWNGFETFVI